MPLTTDPARRDGRLLSASDGRPLARFRAGERDGRPLADVLELEPGVAPDAAVPVLLAELAGWRIAAGPEVGHALIAAGATPRRHSHVMSRDLARDPAPAAWLDAPAPPGLRLTSADRPGRDLAPAYRVAYPPSHPDSGDIPEPERPEGELDEILAGEAMGPLLDCSGLAVRADGGVAAALLIVGSGGTPPLGGPWVIEVFRDPAARGAGAALLRRGLALATQSGLPALSLAVTHANAGARAVYAKLGFADVLESVSVDSP